MQFSVDDMHNLRLQIAEEYSRMTEEAALQDMRARAENTRRAIEELRKTNQQQGS